MRRGGLNYRRGRLFVFQAEDGIRDLVRSRGLGDVYKRQLLEQQNAGAGACGWQGEIGVVGLAFAAVYRNPFGLHFLGHVVLLVQVNQAASACLLYTSDAADERSSVDLGGRRII